MELKVEFDQLRKSNFDVNSWLNHTFSGFPDNAKSAEAVRNLSTLLEKEVESTNSVIHSLTQQIIQHLPRVARDLEVTHKEVVNLQQDMSTGLNEAENVQNKTTVSMSTLEKLDNIKTKLVATSAALQEADKWTSLAKQIEQLLDSGDVSKSYECILGMEKSLSVLNPEQAEERRLILEEMKNRLEALATKHLILAFDTSNTENARYFFNMFSNMERTQQFVKYFQNSEKLKLSQEWRNIVEMLPFKEATIKFYDSLVDHLRSKLQWCKMIFSNDPTMNSINVLIDLYGETVRSLEPSLQFCFDSESKKQPFIEVLIHFNQTTHSCSDNLRHFIDNQSIQPDREKISCLLKTLFAPFLPQYSKYAKYHEAQIVSKIQAATVLAAANAVGGEGVPAMQEKIENSKRLLPELILNIKEGEEKVQYFNRGFGYLYFGKGLNGGLERFADWNQEIFRFLEKSIQNPETHRNLLENTLAFAETCGEISLQLVKLDQMLSTNCSRISAKPSSSDSTDPWEDVWSYYLDNQIRSEIVQFIQKKETLLGKAVNQFRKLCRDATLLVLRVTAEPIEHNLKKNFSLGDSTLKEAIPSEYITQIGEYLMLLPQNLDPFITTENTSISFAFDQTSEEDGRPPVDFILSNLATSICEAYTNRILKVVYLTDGQAKQLAQDIDYVASVLEDLGLRLTADLTDISKLVKNYQNINDPLVCEKISARLVVAVRKMKTKPLS